MDLPSPATTWTEAAADGTELSVWIAPVVRLDTAHAHLARQVRFHARVGAAWPGTTTARGAERGSRPEAIADALDALWDALIRAGHPPRDDGLLGRLRAHQQREAHFARHLRVPDTLGLGVGPRRHPLEGRFPDHDGALDALLQALEPYESS